MLTLKLKTTRIILINNINNLIQQHSADQRRPRQGNKYINNDDNVYQQYKYQQ
jgi:hypothetical protein